VPDADVIYLNRLPLLHDFVKEPKTTLLAAKYLIFQWFDQIYIHPVYKNRIGVKELTVISTMLLVGHYPKIPVIQSVPATIHQ
jgi:hypothetical protein